MLLIFGGSRGARQGLLPSSFLSTFSSDFFSTCMNKSTQGGKTGLTAIVVSFYFLISIFFAPLLASVPPWATGPALIIVGAMMMRGVIEIDWNLPSEAIPAFVTIAIMPLTYSIAYGIIGGLFSWLVINVVDLLIAVARGEEADVFSGLVTRAQGKTTDAVEEAAKSPAPAPQAWAPTQGHLFDTSCAKTLSFYRMGEEIYLQPGLEVMMSKE